MKQTNIFSAIPEVIEDEIFELIVQSDQVKIERIISKGHTSPASGWYDQDQHEWVMVLRGSAVLGFADQPDVKLTAGDHINIPARTKHKVSWTQPDAETVWLAVFY